MTTVAVKIHRMSQDIDGTISALSRFNNISNDLRDAYRISVEIVINSGSHCGNVGRISSARMDRLIDAISKLSSCDLEFASGMAEWLSCWFVVYGDAMSKYHEINEINRLCEAIRNFAERDGDFPSCFAVIGLRSVEYRISRWKEERNRRITQRKKNKPKGAWWNFWMGA